MTTIKSWGIAAASEHRSSDTLALALKSLTTLLELAKLL